MIEDAEKGRLDEPPWCFVKTQFGPVEGHVAPSGLSLVQLKRALRGAAFAFGMLFPLRAEGLLGPAEFDELTATIESLQHDIYAELARLREARDPE